VIPRRLKVQEVPQSPIEKFTERVNKKLPAAQQGCKELADELPELLKDLADDLEQERELRIQFISGLSHDLRNPLTAAKAAAQMIVRRPERAPTLAQRAVEAIDRVDRMIHDLLDANLIRAGQPLPLRQSACDLLEIVRQVVDDLTVIYGTRFKIHCEEARIEGEWDSSNLRRVLENLLTNALKYGADGAPVTIELRAGAIAACCSVHNQGKAIPKEALGKLFQPYQRAATPGKTGWGIGLTLVRGVVDAHGGTIHVQSKEGDGTTFTVYLPREARSTMARVDPKPAIR
jgi:signal transduction histidine kinase